MQYTTLRRRAKALPPEPYETRYVAVWLYQPQTDGSAARDDGLIELPGGIGLATPRICLGDPRAHDWRRVRGTIGLIYPAIDTTGIDVRRMAFTLLRNGAYRAYVIWPDERELEDYYP